MSVLHRHAYALLTSYWRIRRPITLGVRGVACDAEGAVTLVQHSYVPGWHLPGGGVERNETVYDAMVREFREECGIIVTPDALRLIGIFGNFREYKSDHVVLFVASYYTQGERSASSHEIVGVNRFSLDALPSDTSEATRRRLEELRSDSESPHLW